MTTVSLAYGKKSVDVSIPDENFMMVAWPKEIPGCADPSLEIIRALKNPIGSPRISEIAKSGNSVAIVVDDATRPAPTHIMLPPLLKELHEAGIKRENITIIFATGTHRPVTKDEAVRLLGEEIARRYRWINHDCDADDLVYKGKTRFGTPVYVNRIYDDADIKILTGDITLHYYAGFGGGRKSILPGISGRETIQKNHSMLFHPNARAGLHEGNPISEDMTEAAKLAGADFIINVVLNSKKEIVKAFAGDLEAAFLEGIKLVRRMYIVRVPEPADITIASPGGHPFDINLYQAHKAIYFAEQATKRGGHIVVLAECPDGIGNKTFEEWMKKYCELPSAEALRRIEEALKSRFLLGAHKAYYITRTTVNYRLHMLSSLDKEQLRSVYRIDPIDDVQSLINMLIEENPDAKILVLPMGNETLPVPERE